MIKIVSIERAGELMPNGIPKYIRCYDNGGETFDRYTVVYSRTNDGVCHYVGMSEHPFHPQGFGQHGEDKAIIDRPRYSHLGKKISFEELPKDCKKLVLLDYKDFWKLPIGYVESYLP